MRDLDIRQALTSRLRQEHHGDPDTLIVEELGVARGACRVDVAVVNGALCGWEIKSERDTLVRLPAQVEAYGDVFDEATIVASERHLDGLLTMVPVWWGVELAHAGTGGAVVVELHRSPQPNPGIVPVAVAQLLWRDEALALLTDLGRDAGLRSKSRPALWAALADLLPIDDLRAHVRRTLRARTSWRDTDRPARLAARRPLPRRR
jgi:hypothetical protein